MKQRPTLAGITALALALVASACGSEAPVVHPEDLEKTNKGPNAAAADPSMGDEEMSDFVDGVFELQASFGEEDKADLIGMANVCTLVEPVARYGDAMVRGGFVMGVEGTVVTGIVDFFSGYDVVWDMYHQQLAVSRYSGSLTTMDEVALNATAYVGFAAGFRKGVGDWFGAHEAVSLEIGLPYLDDFFSLEITGFRVAIDQDGDNEADSTEFMTPPNGLFGFTVGITGGVDAVTDPLPVEITVSDGYWEPHKDIIRAYYDRFRDARFFGFDLPIAVRMVDAWDGTECDAEWPLVETERDCVLEFGKPGQSHTKRAIHLARSICSVTRSCSMPITWPLAGAALAIAKLRDMGLTPSDLCPGIVDPLYADVSFDDTEPDPETGDPWDESDPWDEPDPWDEDDPWDEE